MNYDQWKLDNPYNHEPNTDHKEFELIKNEMIDILLLIDETTTVDDFIFYLTYYREMEYFIQKEIDHLKEKFDLSWSINEIIEYIEDNYF